MIPKHLPSVCCQSNKIRTSPLSRRLLSFSLFYKTSKTTRPNWHRVPDTQCQNSPSRCGHHPRRRSRRISPAARSGQARRAPCCHPLTVPSGCGGYGNCTRSFLISFASWVEQVATRRPRQIPSHSSRVVCPQSLGWATESCSLGVETGSFCQHLRLLFNTLRVAYPANVPCVAAQFLTP